MPKQLGQHSEEGFVRGYTRYYRSDLIIESENWQALKEELEQSGCEADLKAYYDEYRIFNIALRIQQELCEILGRAYEGNHLIKAESAKKIVVNQTERHLGVSTEEAEKILETEASGNSSYIFTPHVLPYVAGLTLGQIVNLFTNFIKIPNKDTDLISVNLIEFNKKRNELMHNLFSSRIASLELHETIDLGRSLIGELDEIHTEYLFPSAESTRIDGTR